ncbi:hypothetical protein [Nocardiopsis aegyptia]|uniref:Asp23/Gls24 family envelope stress response protein n=1 Tax=Nocardiopsis aegyptia TaxID=220378 RepID=A0A7Z0J853_9ACTN|nr:hypothetical protein [Nocardiopsis aegyptia]NYJ32733.1 hypothetical protein [Nocardiopsis aegyptia]
MRHLLDGRPTEHEAQCSHCRAAARDLAPLIRALGEPELEATTAPAGLVDDVMRAIRAERGTRRSLELDGPGPGTTRIRETAVAAMARFSARGVSGVLVGRCRVHREEEGLAVSLTARVTQGTPIAAAAEEVRRAVRDILEDRLRLTVTRIDIEIVGLIEAD